LNVSNILNLIGTGCILGSLLIRFLLGGRDLGVRSVRGLGTPQRNISAAIVVAAQNFSGSSTLSFVLLFLLPVAWERQQLRARNNNNKELINGNKDF
jgi:BASS family bile acid:Na+ symporter